MSLATGASVMQRLYEDGAMSYPRSDHDALSAESLEVLVRVAERHRLAFEPSLIPRFVPSSATPHEAIHPLAGGAADVNLDVPSRFLQPAHRMMQCLTRAWLRRGATVEEDIGDTTALPEWAQQLKWSRPAASTPLALLYDEERLPVGLPVAGLTLYGRHGIALALLETHDLGRPATIAMHGDHLADRNVLGLAGLTPKGRTMLEQAPTELATPEISRAFERAIDGEPTGAEVDLPFERPDSPLPRIAAALGGVTPTLMPRFHAAVAASVAAVDGSNANEIDESDAVGRAPNKLSQFQWPWLRLSATEVEAETAAQHAEQQARLEALQEIERERLLPPLWDDAAEPEENPGDSENQEHKRNGRHAVLR